MLKVNKIDILKLITPETQDIIVLCQRAVHIYKNAIGPRHTNNRGDIIIQRVFNDNDVYFIIKKDFTKSYIRGITFVIHDIYFDINTDMLPPGMGLISQFDTIPTNQISVKPLKGEIADFMEDYMDEYGSELNGDLAHSFHSFLGILNMDYD